MAQSIREVMTPTPVACAATATVAEAARFMRDGDVGDVLVERDGAVCGIVTDRDLVVRAIADGRDPNEVTLAEVCSAELTALSPTDSVEDAIRLMREKALRRLPVLDDGTAVGIVSIGDLAEERDPDSALADISAAPPNV
jgi:CBS domain-containing protein